MSADERKRLRQALSGYKQLLAAEPEDIGHLEQLARLSLALGQPARAAGFLVARAEVLARRGEMEVALADVRSALAVDSEHAEAAKLRATLERMIDPPPANPSEIFTFRTPRPRLAAEIRARATLPLGPPRPRSEHLIDDLPFDEPIVDASSLLAVHEVDGVEVVSLPTDLPAPGAAWDMAEESRRNEATRPSVQARASLPAVLPAGPSGGPTNPEESLEGDLDQVEALLRQASGGPTSLDGRSAPELPDVELFQALPALTRADLASLGAQQRYRADAVIARPGDPAAELSVIVDGRVRLERPDGAGDPLLELGPGEFLGDLERVYGGTVRIRAVAETSVELMSFEALLVDGLRRKYPAFDHQLRREAARRHGAWLLAANPMFRALGPAERALVSSHLQPQRLNPGALLCEEGARIDFLALVAGGELQVTRDERPIATLRSGRFAGLAALAHEGRASAHISAGDEGALIYLLDRNAIDALRLLPGIRDLLDAAVAQRA